ncbi:energy transducer TonB [Rhodocaloribacter sp.]
MERIRHPTRPRWGMLAALAVFFAFFLLLRFEWGPNRAFRVAFLGHDLMRFGAHEALRAEEPTAVSPVLPPAPPEAFVVVERMPELIGGLASIQRVVRYPALAKKAGIEGRVIVQFVVDEQGRVVDPVVVRGLGAGCDEEAVRAVRRARFRPGTQRGEPVKVKMSVPILFRLG